MNRYVSRDHARCKCLESVHSFARQDYFIDNNSAKEDK